MLSSSDVSQMFAAQNQMFMGQNQYAQQIGISNPSLSLASWGTDPRQRAFGSQGTFGGHAPVSYASTGVGGPGYGGGNRFAGGVMSAVGGIASAGVGLAANPIGAFAGGMGMTGGVADLLGAGAMSRGIGGLVGGGLAGGALAAGATLLPAYAAQKAIGAYVGGAQQQQAIQTSLSGFGFQNSASRTGQGFSRDDAQMIGSQVRAIAHVPEMMTSVEELTKLIPKLKTSGMMSGVKDAAEFNSRFKEAVKTLRDVSRVMGTTMEEATQYFEHSRSVGMLGRTDQIKNAMNIQFTAAQTGMTQNQVMQLQQGGAQMAVGRGIRRSVGATAVTNMAQQFGRGMQMGNISQSDLEDMTGVSGEAAVGAAAQQMTEKLARFAESTAAGRASMMGLAEFDEKGRYKGINKELAQKYASGDITKADLMRRIAGFSSQQKISASRKVGSMAIEFAGATGPGGASSFMKNVLAEGGHTGESAKFMMQKYGFSEVEVDVMDQMQGTQGAAGEDRQRKAFERKRQMEADISDRTDPSKIMSRIGTKMKSGLGLARAESEGGKMFTHIGKAYDEFVDDIVGRYSVELSEKGAQRLLQSLQSQKGKEDMRALFALKAPSLSTVGGTKTQTKTWGDAIGGGGLMSWLSSGTKEGTGDVMEQRKYLQESFGMQGKGAEEINDRFKELQGMGQGEDAMQKEVAGFVSQLDREGKYTEASNADRIKMLSEAMQDAASQTDMETGMKYGGEKTKAIEAFMAKKGLKNMQEVAMAGGEGIVAESTDTEATIRDMGMKNSRSIRAADDHLIQVFGKTDTATTVSSAIASDIQVGHNIIKAMQGDKDVEKILSGKERDPEAGARALEQALGKPEGSISTSEFVQSRDAYKKIKAEIDDLPEGPEKEKKKRDMLMGVAARTMAEATKDISIAQVAAKDLAGGVGEGELHTALKSFASSLGGDDAYQKMMNVQDVITKQSGQLMEAREAVKKAKTPKEKEAAMERLKGIEKGLGKEVTARITQASSRFDSAVSSGGLLNKTESVEKAAADLGVSEEAFKDVARDPSNNIKLTKDVIEKIKKSKVGAEATGGALVGTEAQKQEGRGDQLQKTMTSIDTHIQKGNELQNRMMTVLAMKEGDRADYVKSEHSKDVAAEEAAAKAAGKK